MQLGLGLYRHMLNAEHYRFAKQCGASHVVIHLVDYFNQGAAASDQPIAGGRGGGWGKAGDPDKLWTIDELAVYRKNIEAEGLKLYAIENLDPAHWYDVLLAGPQRDQQLDNIRALIRAMGAVGIPCLGYNFSLAGVYGRVEGNWARGAAGVVGMQGIVDQEPMPDGMVWNMSFNEDAVGTSEKTQISQNELWSRLEYFLKAVIPVAEESGVMLAAHPDDPPVARLRNSPRLVYKADLYQKLIDLIPSKSNGLEFCLGTLAEMEDGDVYDATERYSAQDKIAYVHFRNVAGKVPFYRETFIDEGDIDMEQVLRILKDNHFEGVIIPDHAPKMSCSASWHAGMAYSMGYMKALMDKLN